LPILTYTIYLAPRWGQPVEISPTSLVSTN